MSKEKKVEIRGSVADGKFKVADRDRAPGADSAFRAVNAPFISANIRV